MPEPETDLVSDFGGRRTASASYQGVAKAPSVAWYVVAPIARSGPIGRRSEAAPQRWSVRWAAELSGQPWLDSCLILEEAKG